MRLWRLSSTRRAREFDGGYGLNFPGRWNTPPRPVTCCATAPSLAAVEKRVHVLDASTLPDLTMIEYEVPDDLPLRRLDFSALPANWASREVDTQAIGDQWLDAVTEALLFVPSVIVPFERAPERNVLINHRHPRCGEIYIASQVKFTLDPRLFNPL
jgi:RES domain-containing protein